MIDQYYAGIGSRETPTSVCHDMTEIARVLSSNFILNSGGAGGADNAFEQGAGENKQIFLPFDGFNGRKADGKQFVVLSGEVEKIAKKLAEKYHPAWRSCGFAAKRFHTRNVPQVLGIDLRTPVKFVICYTERGLMKGGTAQALRIAKDKDIPIFNLGKLTKADVLYQLKIQGYI